MHPYPPRSARGSSESLTRTSNEHTLAFHARGRELGSLQSGFEGTDAVLAILDVASELLHKGAQMGCPISASRNSPTSMSVAMAQAWNITLVGYVRRATMRVYTHPERLGFGETVAARENGRLTVTDDGRQMVDDSSGIFTP